MFIDQTLVAVIFRIVNFGLIILLIGYCFRVYVLPSVFVSMAQKESEKESLLRQKVLFEQRQIELEELIKQDQLKRDKLKKNIDKWKEAVDQHQNICRAQKIIQKSEYEKKYLHRQEWQQKILEQAMIARQVVSTLEVSLSENFKHEDVGCDYIEDIVTCMRKNIV